MMREDPVLAKRSVIEQHAHSVLLAVITAVVLYSGSFVVTAREESSRIAVQMVTLTSEVQALRAQIAVMQQAYVTREDFRDHENRVRALESAARYANGAAQAAARKP